MAKNKPKIKLVELRMEISLIAALSEDKAIGLAGGLPWRLPADLQHFKRLTLGHPVLMGRKTWASLGRPLPGRLNLVLSRQALDLGEAAELWADLEAALASLAQRGYERVFIIGGGEIYRQALPLAQDMYLTRVEGRVSGAEAYFPDWSPEAWVLASSEAHPADERHERAFCFEHWRRKHDEL